MAGLSLSAPLTIWEKGRALGLRDQFSRRRLENLPLEVKRPHQGDVGFGEPSAVAGGEINGESLPEFLTVSGSHLAPLLELDDVAADLPRSGGEDGIDRLCGGMTCPVKQLDRARTSS